jgi:F420-non-reducing hydrogenase small subunit
METDKPKLKIASYWAAACGGCCVSILDVNEKLLDIVKAADLVFWPIALDIKYKDIEEMPDGYIDVTLFNGAIRNSENEHMAHLLRHKSKILVAYGSCAHLGGIPGLANLFTKEEVLSRVFLESETVDNQSGIIPQVEYDVPEGKITLPAFYNDVRALDQVVDVDYYIPGCPPQSERFFEVFEAIAAGDQLPPNHSVIGARDKTQCDECERKKTDKKLVKKFVRPWEIYDDGVTCFIEQGVICMGPATRCGCGTRCIKGNAPCRGCYGPSPASPDPGAKMMSAIATMIDAKEPEEIANIIEKIDDPAGTFYRFSLPESYLRRKVKVTDKL